MMDVASIDKMLVVDKTLDCFPQASIARVKLSAPVSVGMMEQTWFSATAGVQIDRF